jgi:hypothetical protein
MAGIAGALFKARWRAAALATLAVSMAASVCFGVEPDGAMMTCTNVASGTSWQIRIDYGKGTVDSYPARISSAEISWHDAADGGNYTLDRASGNLTVVVASSTGGYFLHHHCRLEN